MELELTEDQTRFREALRVWLQQNHPGALPVDRDEAWAHRQRWQARLDEAGYAGLTWPVEWGGRGATTVEQAIFNEEAARAGIPRPADLVALHMVGPTILRHGTDEQKERFLRPILSASEHWCQGFSEPDAGSDLASLKTAATRVDGGWRVSGQKIWTSMAHVSDWCVLLARTDRDAAPHRGLTLFLMDMKSPGIELRPLRQATGDSEFNEMFLDAVEIPDAGVLGEVDGGWQAALTVLMHERAGLAFTSSLEVQRELNALIESCRERGLLADGYVRARLAGLQIEARLLRLTGMRALSREANGGLPGPEGSLAKLRWTKAAQALAAFAMDVLGTDAVLDSRAEGYAFIRSRGNSIEGGTSEIQANIVAERVLGLPRVTA